MFSRRAGILLHPTSLPGPFGVGDLGPAAYRFVDWLESAGQRLWQVLPLGPTGYGDSPYQCFSAFAGNPLLISPERLAEQGLLDEEDLADLPDFPAERAAFDEVQPWKMALLRRAFERARGRRDESQERWEAANRDWLDGYALFMALKKAHGGGPWVDWPLALRVRDEAALDAARAEHADEIAFQRFLQFHFFQQWITLRAYAREKGIAIIGDMPIFIAHDSADAWANPELFHMHPDGRLVVQAGVPPDYFSETGQLWGNPLYDWEAMAARGYDWWIARFRATFNLVDLVRLDHFRGFAAYWAVPGEEKTAIKGSWEPGPGAALFEAVREALGPLPIIAEDLGVITPDVVALRDGFGYPGMRILQFAFTADASAAFLPHNYIAHTVAYTGTHDNDTTKGWYESLDEETAALVRAYLGEVAESEVVRAMIRAVTASVAETSVVPLQDVLELGTEARMNLPGRTGGYWQWRVAEAQLSPERAAWLAKLVRLYGRLDEPDDEEDEAR